MPKQKMHRPYRLILSYERSAFLKIKTFLHSHKLLLFLISLLTLLLLFPVVHEHFTDYLVALEFIFSIILIFGIYIVSANRQLLMIAILLALLILSVIWFNIFLQDKNLFTFGLILEIIFFGLTTTTIISSVLEYKKVTADKIYGAICGYLLLGIVWALIYTAIEHLAPGSFYFLHGIPISYEVSVTHPGYFVHFVYYSFVTLTTLGYGDITPVTNISRAFSSLEAVTGQLYVAVLIARLVGLHISHSYSK